MKRTAVLLLCAFAVYQMAPLFAQEEKEMTLEELTQSRAAQLFQLGEYDDALIEFQNLGQQYPKDSLPKRYIGMTLTLLGRLDESVVELQEAVQLDPQNPAGHYFLARAYHEQGARDKAKYELEEVLRLDPEGFYGKPAKNALPIVQERGRFKVSRPWEIYGGIGYEYDSNVRLEPNDKSLGGLADESANRYFLTIGGTHKWYEKGSFTSKVGYRIYQSFHDDSLDEFNFTFQEFSLDNYYRTKLSGKETTLGLRYDFSWGFLKGDPFSLGNGVTTYGRIRLTPNTRTEAHYRYTHTEFNFDGSRPHLTSRDGEYQEAGLLHRRYFSNYSRWIFAGYVIEPYQTEGNNFDRLGHSFQAGLHSPMPFNNALTLDVLGQFKVANYPHFSTELVTREEARFDNDWTLLVSLTYALNNHWSVRGLYRYVNANNHNDLFQYDRHIGGVELRFRY